MDPRRRTGYRAGPTGRAAQAQTQDQAQRGQKPAEWQQQLSKGTARTTFVIGAVLSLPGATYLAALSNLSNERQLATWALVVLGILFAIKGLIEFF